MANILQSAGMVFSLLNYFTLQKSQWGVRELARETGRSPSVVQRALNLLEQEGFIIQNSISRTYQLGFRCIELGHLAGQALAFSQIAEQLLSPVVEECGETVFIYRRRADFAVCSFILENQKHFRFTAQKGDRLFLHEAPFTQIVLAYMSGDEQADYLQRHHLHHDISLRDALKLWKLQGYSNSREVWQPHTQGISVPLFDAGNRVTGALCIATSDMREDLIIYKDLLFSAADKINRFF
ncbi:helix-turn-helix domain-containing protein [Salmonella enterica subsp. enterica]|nr:helix-turn-helix domain-containing protein [Salmonella enterica subsp. enterica]